MASVADEGGVPVFVRKCVEFVEREGLKAEGIYRVPGKKEHVLLLQDKFEEGKYYRQMYRNHNYKSRPRPQPGYWLTGYV